MECIRVTIHCCNHLPCFTNELHDACPISCTVSVQVPRQHILPNLTGRLYNQTNCNHGFHSLRILQHQQDEQVDVRARGASNPSVYTKTHSLLSDQYRKDYIFLASIVIYSGASQIDVVQWVWTFDVWNSDEFHFGHLNSDELHLDELNFDVCQSRGHIHVREYKRSLPCASRVHELAIYFRRVLE